MILSRSEILQDFGVGLVLALALIRAEFPFEGGDGSVCASVCQVHVPNSPFSAVLS